MLVVKGVGVRQHERRRLGEHRHGRHSTRGSYPRTVSHRIHTRTVHRFRLLAQPDVLLARAETLWRCRQLRITVQLDGTTITTTHPLSPSPACLPRLRVKFHQQSWSLPIQNQPLQNQTPTAVRPWPSRPPSHQHYHHQPWSSLPIHEIRVSLHRTRSRSLIAEVGISMLLSFLSHTAGLLSLHIRWHRSIFPLLMLCLQ